MAARSCARRVAYSTRVATKLRRELAQPYPNLSVQVVAERDHIQQFDTVSTLCRCRCRSSIGIKGTSTMLALMWREAQAEVRRAQLALRDQLADGVSAL